MNELAKLKWQCRRGSRELDLILGHYLETRYQHADDAEKARFADMLKMEDSELLRYVSLTGSLCFTRV